ncbi:LamG-like jellyroll fold domain-containing protein [Sphingomonas aerophila]|uniref:Sialate O-acetylesterase domain-containing protein n=1 Tax=Sphingomonas aerophila TaxID=1344948 RepID=A0A7W9BCR2_9SPHN|nr:LamG-like jellyroll fold domain-containing protein [Sphingomonas aerophila]MBB5714767.1 hypothetical protein [Sphingomonas aerophila]
MDCGSCTEIGQVEKIGTMGASYAKTEFQPLFGPKQKHKGAADYGSLSPSLAHDESDPGQAILRAAADSPNLFAFRVVYPTGAKRFFQGKVFGYPETVDGADALLMVTPTIEINSVIVKVAASGAVVLPSVSLSGALSKSEGDSGTVAYTYIVTLSQAAPVGGTAVPWALAYGSTDANDFAAGQATSGTLTIAQGQLSGTVTINAKGDTSLEGDETFTFLISTPPGYIAGAATSATGTILNDDAPPAPVFTTLPSISPTSGTAGTTVFAATDGVATNATSVTRRWLLGTTSIGTGATVVAPTNGSLTLENTAAGPGGSTTVTSTAVAVAAAASSVNLAMTQLTDGRIYQRSTKTGSANAKGAGSIAVPIALDGAATSIEYRLRDAVANGNPVVQDWTTAASNVAAAATSVTCPNVPARLGWYYLDLRANGGTAQLGTSKIGMGRVVAVSGQSLATRMFTARDSQATVTMASLGITPNANTSIYAAPLEPTQTAYTPSWGANVDGTTGYNSAFAAEFLNRQIAAAGVSCALVGYARGSQSITVFVPGGADNGGLRAALDAVGGFETFIWMQGHTDAKNGMASATYQTNLTSLFADVTAHNATLGSNYDKLIGSIPNINSTSWGTSAQIQAIRNASAAWAAANGGVSINANDIDLYDGVHESQAGAITLADHFYRASRSGLGLAHNDAGPAISSATRAAGSANVVLTISLPSGATALTSVGSPASRFAVFASGSTSGGLALDATTPISISGSTITLKLAAVPADSQALDVYAFYPPDSSNAGQANVIYDNNTDGDGITRGRQLMATLAAVTAAAPVPGTAPTQVGPNLTMTNASYQAGKTGFGQELAGGYGFSPAATDLMAGQATVTLEAWFSVAAAPSSLRVFVGQSQRCFLGVNAQGRLVAGFNKQAAATGATVYINSSSGSAAGTNPVVSDGARHHVALVMTPTGVTLYLDGAQVGSSATAFWQGAATDKFGVGNFNSTDTTFLWTGTLDEVAVWSTAKYSAAFTPPTTPYVGSETGLIGLYHLDGTGNAATF